MTVSEFAKGLILEAGIKIKKIMNVCMRVSLYYRML